LTLHSRLEINMQNNWGPLLDDDQGPVVARCQERETLLPDTFFASSGETTSTGDPWQPESR